ncbi:MAG: 50S ribosomal protein L9 [Lentisphaeria bacterium]|nr:50S ribosomal protein L9 [Lentisphaeria bacterium]
MAATMNLILLQDVEDLGLAGDSVHVSPGFGRNYLIPRGLAAPASAVALRQLEAQKEKIEAKRKADLEAAQALAAKIAEMSVEIPMQASDDDHLFGSVTERVVCEAYAAKGVQIEHQRVRMDKHIRTLGEYDINIKLHQDVIATGKIVITRA